MPRKPDYIPICAACVEDMELIPRKAKPSAKVGKCYFCGLTKGVMPTYAFKRSRHATGLSLTAAIEQAAQQED